MTVFRALWSPASWRATLHVLLGLPISALTIAVVVVTGSIWASLLGEWQGFPGTNWFDLALWTVLTPLSPFWLLWTVRGASALQRERFRARGVTIAPPRGSLRTATAYRQGVHHLVDAVLTPLAATLIVFCWTAPLLAPLATAVPASVRWPAAIVLFLLAPWAARGFATLDAGFATALLNPGRSETLALRVEELARSRAEVVEATDAERRRIERDLHDGVQQRLVALAMNLGMARNAFTDLPPEVREVLDEAHEEAKQAVAELRSLVRGMSPPVLSERGLDAALSGLAARAPLPVSLDVDVEDRCAPTVEAVAYFVVSEALTNVARHAGARSASVDVVRKADTLRLTVTDDGKGGASLGTAGSGLRGLTQRVSSVDGTLRVDSPEGGPTVITAELPCG